MSGWPGTVLPVCGEVPAAAHPRHMSSKPCLASDARPLRCAPATLSTAPEPRKTRQDHQTAFETQTPERSNAFETARLSSLCGPPRMPGAARRGDGPGTRTGHPCHPFSRVFSPSPLSPARRGQVAKASASASQPPGQAGRRCREVPRYAARQHHDRCHPKGTPEPNLHHLDGGRPCPCRLQQYGTRRHPVLPPDRAGWNSCGALDLQWLPSYGVPPTGPGDRATL